MDKSYLCVRILPDFIERHVMDKTPATSIRLPQIHKLGVAVLVLVSSLLIAGTYYYENERATLSDSEGVKYLFWIVAAFMLVVPANCLRELGRNPEDFCYKNWTTTKRDLLYWCLFAPLILFFLGIYHVGLEQMAGNILVCLPSFIITVLVIGLIRIERRHFLLKEERETVLPAEKS